MVKEGMSLSPSTPPNSADSKEYVPYDDRWTTIAGKRVKVKATTADLARKIHNHTMTNEYTHVILSGVSGSGKNTVRQDILHQLHTRHPYVIKFFKEKQIINLVKILHQLPKHRDYILCFDDVSYLVKKGVMKEEDVSSMLFELSKVRHTVHGRVITIFSIHYSYAIEKALRQASYRVMTSITDDEREIYSKIFGPYNRPIIEQFVNDYRMMTQEGCFYLPNEYGQFERFESKNPLKLAIASRLGEIGYLVYHKVNCNVCSEAPENNEIDKNTIAEKFAKNPKAFTRATKWAGFVLTGVSVLNKNDRALYNWWINYIQDHNVDFKALVEILKDVKAAPKDQQNDFMIKRLTELEQVQKTRKIESIPDEMLVKEEDKEPEPENVEAAENALEAEDKDEEDDEDEEDDSLFEGVNFSMGGLE